MRYKQLCSFRIRTDKGAMLQRLAHPAFAPPPRPGLASPQLGMPPSPPHVPKPASPLRLPAQEWRKMHWSHGSGLLSCWTKEPST